MVKMEQINNKKTDLKTFLKKVFLTGAAVCTVAISLVGCSLQNDNIYKDFIPSVSVSEDNEREESKNNSIGDYAPDYGSSSNTDNYTDTTSYNAFLYSSGSLSSVIPMNNFGLTMSKYTDNADRRLQVGNYEGIDINLGNENYKEYLNWVDSKDVTYVYAHLYPRFVPHRGCWVSCRCSLCEHSN